MDENKFVQDSDNNKTCVVVGTRPGIIKMSPIIAELNDREAESFTIHAGQHYSYNLDGKMFEDLRLNKPKYRVEGVEDTSTHGGQTATMLEGIESILLDEKPQNVLVCGDANFNLAGALAARKLRLNVGHVEAGLRSGDWRMPEEHNRVMIDHISDWLFVPTSESYENAVEDNVHGDIILTGNTIVDAVDRNIEIALNSSNIVDELGINGRKYSVLTAHREENVDDKETLSSIIDIIDKTTSQLELPVIYPIHPRTKKRLEQFGLFDTISSIEDLELVDPLGYLDFLKLLYQADVVITDSGGIQEEACILQVPCVTIRDNTERPETVEVGANVVSGTNPNNVINNIKNIRKNDRNWSNPFGEGNAAQTIVDTVVEN